jgi:hypothetical protein
MLRGNVYFAYAEYWFSSSVEEEDFVHFVESRLGQDIEQWFGRTGVGGQGSGDLGLLVKFKRACSREFAQGVMRLALGAEHVFVAEVPDGDAWPGKWLLDRLSRVQCDRSKGDAQNFGTKFNLYAEPILEMQTVSDYDG